MVSSNLLAGVIALISIRAVNAGACRPISSSAVVTGSDTIFTTETSVETLATSDETTTALISSLTTAETSIETSILTLDDTTTIATSSETPDLTTLLTTTGFTTDLTTFITLTETESTATTDLASTTTPMAPADLFPCQSVEDCRLLELCDGIRCGCINRMCEQLTDTTTTAVPTTIEVAP